MTILKIKQKLYKAPETDPPPSSPKEKFWVSTCSYLLIRYTLDDVEAAKMTRYMKLHTLYTICTKMAAPELWLQHFLIV
jgi:hypothetical protein